MDKLEWHTIETAPADVPVWTKIHDEEGLRNVQVMRRMGRFWWVSSTCPTCGTSKPSRYVYYTPTHWAKRTG